VSLTRLAGSLARTFPLLLALAAPAQARVVLIGIDGGSWNLIDAGWRTGELPNLRAVAARGVQARLATVEPTNSPTIWTTIATGRSPGAHGVTHFYATRHAIRTPVVFESLARQGLRVGLYDYLVTWPPPELTNGFVIPGWMRRSPSVTPADVFARAGLTPYSYSSEQLREPEAVVANLRLETAEKAPRFVRLLQHFDLDLGAVTFYAMDSSSHRFWHAAFPSDFSGEVPAAPPEQRAAIGEALRGIDRAVGTIAAALAPGDTLILVSDHGFRADPRGVRRKWVTHLARPLAGAGLAARGARVVTGWREVVVDLGPEPSGDREQALGALRALLEDAATQSGEALFEVSVTRRAPRAGWFDWAFDSIEALLADPGEPLASPDSYATLYASVREDAVASVWPNGRVRIGGREVAARELFHAVDFSGEHDPIGIFLAAGGPIVPRAERGQLSVLDIAPLLLVLLGRPVPAALEGRAPLDWLTPEFVRAHPLRRVAQDDTLAPAEALRTGAERPGRPSTSDAELTEQLRSLGYAE
jgi:hypothetical protein